MLNNCAKRIIAATALVSAVLLCAASLQKNMCLPLEHNEVRISDFHKEPENSLDVVLLGSSPTYHSFSSVYAYEQFGFTSYPYTLAGSACTMWKPAMKDILSRQHPKLVIVDVFGGGYEPDYLRTRTYSLYIIMNNTRLSLDKIKTSKELERRTDGENALLYLFPIIKYHSNIVESFFNIPDRIKALRPEPISPLKGSYLGSRVMPLDSVEPFSFTEETLPLDRETETVILDFIDFCTSKGVKLLFVKYPSVIAPDDEDEIGVDLRSNRILEIAREKGCLTYNLQKQFYDINLVEAEDFENRGHVNVRGQKKITEYLGRYIQDELGIQPTQMDILQKTTWNETISYYDAYVELSEYLISINQEVKLNEYIDLADALNDIIEGVPVDEVSLRFLE